MVKRQVVPAIARRLLYRDTANEIRRLIRRKRLWEKYLGPERELAAAFGVSRDTVRKSLEVLERQGVIVRRHGQGTLVLPQSEVRTGGAQRRLAIASYYQTAPGPYTAEVLAGLSEASGENRWFLSFNALATPAGRREFFAALRAGEFDGIFLLSLTDRELVEEVLGAWHGPTVLVDHHFPRLPISSVRDDSRDGARQAVEHLLSLGHRRIGYVEISRREDNPWRYAGYAEALRGADIEPDERLVAKAFTSFESGRLAGEHLLALDDPPTAVFAFDDLRAWGVWRAAEARGLEVGRNFALVGYGDAATQAGFPEELSSVRFSARQMGLAAVREMDGLIARRAEPGRIVRVPTEFVARRSSVNARVED